MENHVGVCVTKNYGLVALVGALIKWIVSERAAAIASRIMIPRPELIQTHFHCQSRVDHSEV